MTAPSDHGRSAPPVPWPEAVDWRLTRRFVWRGRNVQWRRLGSGPPVVLCHGTPWSSWVWAPLARALSARWSVHVWDMPGFGQSDMRPGDVSLAAQGTLLAALLRHWRLDRPHVIAHDIGGAVALRAHLLHGATYRSLALVDAVALAPWGSDFFRLVADNADVFAALPGSMHEALVRAYVAGASATGLPSDTLDTLVAPWLGPAGQTAFYRQIAQAEERHTDEVSARHAHVSAPTIVVWGADDSWIPVDRAHRLADAIPDAELEIIPRAGHLVQLDQPVAMTMTLYDWLRRQSAPS